MESHEVDTDARNPLWIALFAQATLGLVKNMRTCTCFIGSKELALARCVHTGLLLINYTAFKDRSEPLPACVKLCVVGQCRYSAKSRNALVTFLADRDGCCFTYCWTCNQASGSERHQGRKRPTFNGA